MESNIRGGISGVVGDRYAKLDENRKILYEDANNLYGHSRFQPLPFVEITFDKNVELEDIIKIPDDSDIGYFIEIDLNYPDKMKEKTKNFPFAPVIKKYNPDIFSDFLKTIKPDTCAQTNKLICDWSDKKNYLIHCKMLKLYVRHGMEREKVHTVISFKQSKRLENYINF